MILGAGLLTYSIIERLGVGFIILPIAVIILAASTLYVMDITGNVRCDQQGLEYSYIQENVHPDYVKCIENVYDNVSHKRIKKIEHILKR
jgi:hypothetical protein